MAYEIDQIHIYSRDEAIEFSYKEGKWSRCVTTWETVDGVREESSSISACTAEDVIVALLLNMSYYGKDIAVSKGPIGTWVPTQGKIYEGDYGRSPYRPDNPLYWLVGNDELKLK